MGGAGPAVGRSPTRAERPPLPLDARLVPAALAGWATAAVAVATTPAVLAAVAAIAALAAAALAVLRRAGTLALALVVVAAVAVSVLSAQVVRGTGLLQPLAVQGATAVVEGSAASDAIRVRADPTRPWASRSPRWVVRLDVERVSGRGRTSSARAPVVVIGGQGWDRVRRGDDVRAVGVLSAAEPGDSAVALLTAVRAPRTTPPEERPARWAQRLRAGLVSACAGLPADARALLPGLVVGDVTAVPDDLDAAVRATGLAHLTAVSGGNTALVTGVVLAVATAAGLGRRRRLVLAGAALLGFAVLTGGEPSVLRAAVMGAAVLVGSAFSRGGGGLPALALAVCGLLVSDPWLGRSAGFGLSVVATGALLVLAPAWTAALMSRFPRLPRWLASAVAVPVAAQVVCGPVVLLLAPGVALLAVPANLLAAPAVAPATLLGLVATLLEPVWPSAASVAARLGGLGAQWVALVARTGAAMPGSQLPWPQGPLPAAALAALTAAVLLAPRIVRLARRAR